MANSTVLHGGQVNGLGDENALFLKVFGGEVMAAFDEVNVFKDKHQVRNIANGKSAQFPATWKVGANYHTPGTEILGQAANLAERIITIDDLLLSDVFFANIEEAKSHFDYRSEYTRQVGIALANQYDKNVAQTGVLAARALPTVTGGYDGGEIVKGTAVLTDAPTLGAGIWAAAQMLDEKDVPANDRCAFLRPAQYYLLAQDTNLLNKFWGGAGSLSEGYLPEVAGIDIVKTNHLPNTNITTSFGNKYDGDFTKTACLVMNKGAVGTVQLLDLATEAEYDIRRQGTLVVAKYALGHGILRPECAVEIKTVV